MRHDEFARRLRVAAVGASALFPPSVAKMATRDPGATTLLEKRMSKRI